MSERSPSWLLEYPPGVIVPRRTVPSRETYGHTGLEDFSQWQIESLLYLDDTVRQELSGLPRWRHLLNMLLLDFPPEGGFRHHWWVDEACYHYCEHGQLMWWGSGGTGKSEVIGYLTYEDFKASPDDTIVLHITTSHEKQDDRAFGAALKAYEADASPPGDLREVRSQPKKIERRVRGRKRTGLFTAAFGDGVKADTIQRALGVHARRVVVVFDEANGIPDLAFEDGLVNASRGTDHFRVVCLMNPKGFFGAAQRACTPLECSRKEVVSYCVGGPGGVPEGRRESIAFRSRGLPGVPGDAVVLHADGTRNPSILHHDGEAAGPVSYTHLTLPTSGVV